ncbi:Bax inhibitor-1/YccA family protein, partial [Candidatus Dojkabacteria bacterium]
MQNDSFILEQTKGFGLSFSSFMTKVLGLMSIGLFVSFGVALFIILFAESSSFALSIISILAIPTAILQLVIVFALSFFIEKFNALVGSIVFVAYSALTGLTLGLIMMSYNLFGIVTALGATFITFSIMAIFGYSTKMDLSKIGGIALMGLIGLVIASLFNIVVSLFSPSFATGFNWILTYLGVAIFLVLTAWDVQKLKTISQMQENENKLVVLGSLTLYLDFINLFIYMLRIFGSR